MFSREDLSLPTWLLGQAHAALIAVVGGPDGLGLGSRAHPWGQP